MALSLLNLRSSIAGQKPTSLQPGQICFNLADKLMFVGDGSSSNSDFNGGSTPGVSGSGWFSMPLDEAGFGESFLISPSVYGQMPVDGDTLQWNSGLDHLEWVPGGSAGGGSAGYLMTNSEVVSAAGASVTAKINAVIAPAVAQEGNTAVVQGVSGDLYEGVYFFIGSTWEFGAFYAQPTAAAVTYDNAISGLAADDVQGAIDELSADKVESPVIPPTPNQVLSWSGTETVWTSDAGGSVQSVSGTTPVEVDNSDPANPVVNVDPATLLLPGVVQLEDSISSTSTTTAATPNSVKTTYDLANTALPNTGGTMTGDIVFANGQPVDAGLF